MSLSGVDTAVFRPHSCPSASSSTAKVSCDCTLYYIQANGPQNLRSTSFTSARLSGMISLMTRNLQIVY